MVSTAWTYSMDLMPSGVVAANATPAGIALCIALGVSGLILLALAIAARRRESGEPPAMRACAWDSPRLESRDRAEAA